MADEEEATPSDEPPAAAKASVPPKVLRAHFEDRFDRVIEEAPPWRMAVCSASGGAPLYFCRAHEAVARRMATLASVVERIR